MRSLQQNLAQCADSRARGGMAAGWAWGAGAELSGVASSLLLCRVAEQGLNKGPSSPLLGLRGNRRKNNSMQPILWCLSGPGAGGDPAGSLAVAGWDLCLGR